MSNLYTNTDKRALCSLSLGSMTQAIKAKRILSRSDIAVNVKKLSTSGNERGCIYGIEYPCELSGNIRVILQRNGVETVL